MAKTKLTTEFITKCYEWICANGLIDDGGAKFVDFCKAMSISDDSYYRWLNENYKLSAEFAESIKRAKDVFRQNLVKDLVQSLAKSAKGYTWKRTKTEYRNKNGKPEIVKQTVEDVNVPPNTGAAIFLLTNIAPDKWQNKQFIDAKETHETKIKVDADAEILNEIPAEVLADITETLQLAMQKEQNNEAEETTATEITAADTSANEN